nr:uncharacterized protein LOC111429149 [Onthophagus taurus]
MEKNNITLNESLSGDNKCVKEKGDSCSPNDNNEEYLITKEGELLPKIQIKLEEVIKSKGITNFTIDVSAGSSVGDNFLGFIGKLVIKGIDKNNKPIIFNWIVKTAPTQDIFRKVLKIEILYTREIYVYTKIFPIFERFQKEKSLLSPFKHYPKIIFSYLEPYCESFAMEDMKSIGYIMRNRKQTLDYNHVKFVLKTYAKFHAVSYALKDQKIEVFNELRENTKDSMVEAYAKELAAENINNSMQQALETLNKESDIEVYEKFKKLSENFTEVYYDLISKPTEYGVIGHGDSWINNMLWLYDNENNIKDVCILDYQLCRYGSPACDLSYFIFATTEKELRDKYYNDMIMFYYYHLCQQIIEMGSNPEKCLPLSQLNEEIKRFSIVGMHYSIMVLGFITKDSNEIPNLRDGNKKLEDLGVEWKNKGKNHGEYCRRVRDCLLDCYEKGYFEYYV